MKSLALKGCNFAFSCDNIKIISRLQMINNRALSRTLFVTAKVYINFVYLVIWGHSYHQSRTKL